MTVDLTASHDARQPSAICQNDDDILWLQPREARRASTGSRSRKVLLRLTTTIGLGAFMTMATATAATAPAAAAGQSAIALPEPLITLPAVAEVDMSEIEPSGAIEIAPPSTEPAPAQLTGEFDPLKAFVPVAAADDGDLRKQIILSMRLTSPPVDEWGEVEREIRPARMDFMTFDEMRVPRWIVDAILRASDETGVDPVYMMALADKESSFLPSNKASTSSAQGLYQFITSTWLEVIRSFGAKHGLSAEAEAIQVENGNLVVADETMRDHILGLRRNPYLSALMAAEMKKRDRSKIENKLGRKISRSEFYLSHFFGANSAGKFMSLMDEKPKQSAPQVFPAAARANRALFFAKAGRKTRQLTVAEVYGKIDEMIDKRLDRYGDVSALAVADAEL
jgi:Transglycosylase SLT domain